MLRFNEYEFIEGEDATLKRLNEPLRDMDSRIHVLESLQVAWEAEVKRLRDLSFEHIKVLFQDAAALYNAYATLGTLLSVKSETSATIGTGEIVLWIAEADRPKVPSAAFISAAPQGVADTWAAGFMTSWNPASGEMRFSATTSLGTGTYSDWVIGLSVSGGAIEPDSVPQVTKDYVASALAPVIARIVALENVPPPDPTFALAYARHRSAA